MVWQVIMVDDKNLHVLSTHQAIEDDIEGVSTKCVDRVLNMSTNWGRVVVQGDFKRKKDAQDIARILSQQQQFKDFRVLIVQK